VDIFSKTYLCVPVHNDGHWSVLILGHPAAHTMKHGGDTHPNTVAATKPLLLHVDSMLGGHDTEKTAEQLYPYLKKEWSRLVS
jgi:Ulp1 family protease